MKFESALEASLKGMAVAYHAATTPDQLAIISEFGDLTYGQLNKKANQLAHLLREKGLKAGDSLALACVNRAEFAEVYAASLRSGIRFTPINFHLNADEMIYIVDNCEAKAFIVDHSVGTTAVETAKKTEGPAVRLSIGGLLEGFESYEEALGNFSQEDVKDPSRGTVMFYTSGTTGRPKGVIRRPVPSRATKKAGEQADLGTPTALAEKRSAVKKGESVVLCTGPLYHAAPMAGNLVLPLYTGLPIVLMTKFDPERTLELIEKHGVTHTHVVATMFHRLLGLPEGIRKKYDLSSLQRVVHGAAPTPVHIKQAMMDWLGPIIHEYYASTESGGCTITPEEWLKKPGSVGKPMENQELRILDDGGKVVKTGEVGTIYFDSKVSGGFDYFKADEKTASAYRDNMYTLGDQGYFDEDGYLFLTGRSSELIISGGVNIYPAEIDSVLLMHPSVRDAAVVGVPNEEFGEEVKAVVELNPAFDPDDKLAVELMAFCWERLPKFKCPRSVDFTKALPRSDAGKVYRKKVREPYWKGYATT